MKFQSKYRHFQSKKSILEAVWSIFCGVGGGRWGITQPISSIPFLNIIKTQFVSPVEYHGDICPVSPWLGCNDTWQIWPWFTGLYDDVIKWKHFPRYWTFVQEIRPSLVNSPYKGQWRGALMFSLICAWINAWVNKHEAGDLRRHRTHYDVIVMNFDSRLQCVDWL